MFVTFDLFRFGTNYDGVDETVRNVENENKLDDLTNNKNEHDYQW